MITAKEYLKNWINERDHIKDFGFGIGDVRQVMEEYSVLYHQSKISKSESPQCVSDSHEASGALHTGYQMEGGAVESTNTSEAVTVPLPKRSDDGNNKLHEKIDQLIDRKDLLEKYVEHLASAIINDNVDRKTKIEAARYWDALDRTA